MSVSKNCSRSTGFVGRSAVPPLGGRFPPGRHSSPSQKYHAMTREPTTRNQIDGSSSPGASGSSSLTTNTCVTLSSMFSGTYRPSVELKTYHLSPFFSQGPTFDDGSTSPTTKKLVPAGD